MAYFEELNNIIFKVVELVTNDTDLCKIINYNGDDPLSEPDFNHRDLIFTKIFPLPKQPDSQTEAGTVINIHFANAQSWKNTSFKKEILLIDIMCHLNTWKFDYGLRPYMLSERFDRLLDNKYIKDISMNNIYLDSWTEVRFSDMWYGYRMAFVLTNNTNVGDSK